MTFGIQTTDLGGQRMNKYFNVGDVIYGFCNGFFGDDYDDKICVLVNQHYAVFQSINRDDGLSIGSVLNNDGYDDWSVAKYWKIKEDS